VISINSEIDINDSFMLTGKNNWGIILNITYTGIPAG